MVAAADTSVPPMTVMDTGVTASLAVTVIAALEKAAIGETVNLGVITVATASIETAIIATVTAIVALLAALLLLLAESAAIAALRLVALDLVPRVVTMLLRRAAKLTAAGVGKLDV